MQTSLGDVLQIGHRIHIHTRIKIGPATLRPLVGHRVSAAVIDYRIIQSKLKASSK